MLLEQPNKKIMNPMRVKMLKLVEERGEKETTAMYLRNKTGAKLESCNTAIQTFGLYGLITFTGGGWFVITEKGKQYLAMREAELAPKEETTR